MGWFPCPDCCECWGFTDLFDPEQFAPLWVEANGVWSFAAGKIHVDDTTDAVLILAEQPPRTPQHHRVTISVSSATTGDKPRIILNYQDADNYFFAEYTVDGALGLYRRAGGSNSLLASCTPSAMWVGDFTAGMTDQYFYASFSGAVGDLIELGDELYVCDPVRFPGASKAGFGNGGGSALDFAKVFHIDEVWPPKDDCPKTICTCEGFCLPSQLLMTISMDPGGDCTHPNGQSVILERDLCSVDDKWRGTIEEICTSPLPGSPPEDFQFAFGCHDFDANEFEMRCNGFTAVLQIANPTSCDPVLITFGPIEIDGGVDPDPDLYQGNACCDAFGDLAEVFLTVTEVP